MIHLGRSYQAKKWEATFGYHHTDPGTLAERLNAELA
jgi:hypothetical protein